MKLSWIEGIKFFSLILILLLAIDVFKALLTKDGQESVSKKVFNIKYLILTTVAAFVGTLVYLLILVFTG